MQTGDWRGAPTAEPNVIPMIDILLVLIIIFMANVGARKAFDLQLPEESKGPVTEAGERIVLEVLPGGVLAINKDTLGQAELGSRLRAVYEARPRKVLYVKGDPKVTYQDVMSAIDVARGAGVLVIGIAPKDVR